LVVRTNTVYTPTVTLGDKHILGYQVQHFLPDEQVTNQYVVSYTDPPRLQQGRSGLCRGRRRHRRARDRALE
jgi:hypothetical protein